MLKHSIIVVLLFFYANFFAQEPISFTTKQGLPTNHVYDLAEDENGFMWFATKQGLVKYDGETFKTFTIKDGLPNNDTWLIENDYQGRLWYFSKSAYQGYIKNDSIFKFSTLRKEVITPRFTYKTKDSLWIYGSSGLQRFNNTNIIDTGLYSLETRDVFNEKLLNIQQKHGFVNGIVMPGMLNPETKEYLFFQKNKILLFDWELNFKKEIPISFPLNYTNRKIENQGLLYNQVAYYAIGKGVLFIDFRTYKAYYKSFKDLIGIKDTKYFRCIGTKTEIQASIPGRLMVFDYQLNFKNTYAFSENLGKSSYKDSQGNIWLTDLSNGVSLIPNTQLQTHYYLLNKKVQKINSIQTGFYAGINDEGFFKLDNDTNTFYPLNQFNRSNAEIYQIKENPITNQNYFISANKTYSLRQSKLEVLNIKSLEFYRFKHMNPYLAGIKDLAYYQSENYLVTGNYLIKSKNPNEFSKALIEKSGLLFTEVFKDNLYIGGSDGLQLVSNDSLVKLKLKNELLNVSVSSISASKDYLCAGTDGRGIYLYDETEVYHIKETDGLSVQRIMKNDNVVWLATQKGVKKIELNLGDLTNSKIIDAFYETDGLLQNNTNDIYIEDNYLYAASDIGLAKLNLNNPVYKQKVKLYFKTSNDTISYKGDERDNVSITFALHDYVNQEHITYQYKLLPTQKGWVNTETKVLNFSNLSPNLYTLEVKATDQHNNSSVIKQYIKVLPKWYETTSNKIAFGMLLLAFIILSTKAYKKRIKSKAEQDKRISGLELQALRSQMNPHFVHNSLNAIQYFIQRKEVELSENYLSKFSQLIRLFFEYSRRQSITIQEEIELLTKYLEIEKLRFEEKLEFYISVCKDIDVEEQHIPSMLLQPIVENGVNHGLFHKKENGIITINFKQLDTNTFEVKVEDDGIGINKSKAIFKASSKNYQSNSSAVLRERLDLLNKGNHWFVKYNIQDISEVDTTKTGTIVTLTFKHIQNR